MKLSLYECHWTLLVILLYINIGSSKGSVPSEIKILPQPMLIKYMSSYGVTGLQWDKAVTKLVIVHEYTDMWPVTGCDRPNIYFCGDRIILHNVYKYYANLERAHSLWPAYATYRISRRCCLQCWSQYGSACHPCNSWDKSKQGNGTRYFSQFPRRTSNIELFTSLFCR